MSVRLRITVVQEYDAEPSHYDDQSPGAIAAIDEQMITDDPMFLIEMFDDTTTYRVEPVGVEGEAQNG